MIIRVLTTKNAVDEIHGTILTGVVTNNTSMYFIRFAWMTQVILLASKVPFTIF